MLELINQIKNVRIDESLYGALSERDDVKYQNTIQYVKS